MRTPTRPQAAPRTKPRLKTLALLVLFCRLLAALVLAAHAIGLRQFSRYPMLKRMGSCMLAIYSHLRRRSLRDRARVTRVGSLCLYALATAMCRPPPPPPRETEEVSDEGTDDEYVVVVGVWDPTDLAHLVLLAQWEWLRRLLMSSWPLMCEVLFCFFFFWRFRRC
ncbi:hypothetical protein F4779DRAFT_577754 [Xylariaceae sp. FL0662B]|nr:hypothetical protein F4779DRAFT_577754 [Xylariaceae sp. FL0662B]